MSTRTTRERQVAAVVPEPRVKCMFPDRTMHIVDIENLVGSAVCGPIDVSDVCVRYRATSGFKVGDLVTVASSPFAAVQGAQYAWEDGWGGRPEWKLRGGEHGADLELLDSLRPADIVPRFGRVVIGSGDGIFARSCLDLWKAGVDVTVVARNASSLSARTCAYAIDIRLLDLGSDFAPNVSDTTELHV